MSILYNDLAVSIAFFISVKLEISPPELLKMRAGKIKAELEKAEPKLFASGLDNWWRDNPIFPKQKGGRDPK